MIDVRKLKDRAAAEAERGHHGRAAELLAEVVAAEPRDLAARQKLAEALHRAGDLPGAVRVYRELADRYSENGQLVKAVAICKVILTIEPAHQAMQQTLAALCARRDEPAPPVPEEAAGVTLVPSLEGSGAFEAQPLAAEIASPAARGRPELSFASPYERIVERARAAGPIRGVSPAPALSAVSLFSGLPPEALLALADRVTLHRVPVGTVVLREGDVGTSFFALASGRVRVEKASSAGRVVLAHLGEGAFFGEMALLSGAQRVASVVAVEECELLELRAEVLAELAREHPALGALLTAFYRWRLLANALVTSPLFRPFSPADRLRLMRRFTTREHEAGEMLVRQGEASPGLFVVLSGEVDVTRAAPVAARGGSAASDANLAAEGAADPAAGEDAPRVGAELVARLAEGDVFGEMSCLAKRPATATVTVRRRATVLALPRADFDAVMAAYPQVLDLVAGISDERRRGLGGEPILV